MSDACGRCRQAFRLLPTRGAGFPHSSYREALDRLLEAVENRVPLVLVAGGPGTGKTTLLHDLADRLGRSGYPVVAPEVTHAGLERLPVDSAMLPESRSGPRVGVWSAPAEPVRDGTGGIPAQPAAILLDEIAGTRSDAVRSLLRRVEGRVPVIVAGANDVERAFEGMPEAANCVRLQLRPISPQEVGAYMDHRLKIVGHRAEDVFTAAAVEQIAARSCGIPRLINLLAQHGLHTAVADGSDSVTAAVVEAVAESGLQHLSLGEGLPVPAESAPVSLRRLPVPAQPMPDAGETYEAPPITETPSRIPAGAGRSRARRIAVLGAVVLFAALMAVPAQPGLPPPQVADQEHASVAGGILPGGASEGLQEELRKVVAVRDVELAEARAEIARLRSELAEFRADAEARADIGLAVGPLEPVSGDAGLRLAPSAAPRQVASAPPKTAEHLIERGHAALAGGDVVGARLFYGLALDYGDARAATALGRTHDPIVLGKLGLGIPGDADLARRWYLRAADLGDREGARLAEAIVERLRQQRARAQRAGS